MYEEIQVKGFLKRNNRFLCPTKYVILNVRNSVNTPLKLFFIKIQGFTDDHINQI